MPGEREEEGPRAEERPGEEGCLSICCSFSSPGPEWKEPARPLPPPPQQAQLFPPLGSPVRGWDRLPRTPRRGSEGLWLPLPASRLEGSDEVCHSG